MTPSRARRIVSRARAPEYVLKAGLIPLLVGFLRVGVAAPLRLAKALRLVWTMGRRAERPFPVHFIYLLEACQILHWLRAAASEHLHAHFGTNSAEVAMLVHELGGPPWSFTAHGLREEEFDKAKFIGLPEKIVRARFVVAISSFGRSQALSTGWSSALGQDPGRALPAWSRASLPMNLPPRRPTGAYRMC